MEATHPEEFPCALLLRGLAVGSEDLVESAFCRRVLLRRASNDEDPLLNPSGQPGSAHRARMVARSVPPDTTLHAVLLGIRVGKLEATIAPHGAPVAAADDLAPAAERIARHQRHHRGEQNENEPCASSCVRHAAL